jgi:hypothetical protein
VEALRASGTTATWRGAEADLAGGVRVGGGPVTAGWRGDESAETPGETEGFAPEEHERSRNGRIGADGSRPSYVVAAAGVVT